MQKFFSILSFFFIGLIISVGLLPGSVFADIEPAKQPIASKINQNLHSVLVNPGSSIDFVVNFQNIGQQSWHKYRLVTKQKTNITSSNAPSFAEDSWQSPTFPVSRDKEVSAGQIIEDTIRLKAPDAPGVYNAEFFLEVDDQVLEEVVFSLPVTVTDNSPSYVPVDEGVPSSTIPENEELAPEPRIRVGFWKPDGFVQFRSDEADYDIYDGKTLVGTLPMGRLGVLKYEDGQYKFSGAGMDVSSNQYIRLSPVGNPHAVFTLLNLKRRVKSEGKNNFNSYRGAMEYRLSQDGKTMYVINDLLFEDYMAGIAETSNGAPIEYIKALITAARTYAYYIQSTNKHDKRNFDVVGSTGDQLYLGYVREQIAPRVVEAAKATRGSFITYNDAVVITPYFGHSNGKTKSWQQVWSGATKPWLVSVKAGYDKGRKQFGHGVGMSQRDAAIRADKEKLDWQSLVKYYYKGVEIKQLYQ